VPSSRSKLNIDENPQNPAHSTASWYSDPDAVQNGQGRGHQRSARISSRSWPRSSTATCKKRPRPGVSPAGRRAERCMYYPRASNNNLCSTKPSFASVPAPGAGTCSRTAPYSHSLTAMNLTELKTQDTHRTRRKWPHHGTRGGSRMRKQDLISRCSSAGGKGGTSWRRLVEILQDVSASCAPPTAPTWPDRTTSTWSPSQDPALQPAHRRYRGRHDNARRRIGTLFATAQGRRHQFRRTPRTR